jgi:hypothetical protein
LPRVWRQHRERIQAHNGGFVFRGYGEIARRWLITPNFIPIHPPGLASKNLVSDAAVLEPDFATQPRFTLGAHGS